jgi:hypothetical protein
LVVIRTVVPRLAFVWCGLAPSTAQLPPTVVQSFHSKAELLKTDPSPCKSSAGPSAYFILTSSIVWLPPVHGGGSDQIDTAVGGAISPRERREVAGYSKSRPLKLMLAMRPPAVMAVAWKLMFDTVTKELGRSEE